MTLASDVIAFSGTPPADAMAIPVRQVGGGAGGASSSGTPVSSGVGKRAPVTANISASGQTIIAAQGAGTRIVIRKVAILNRGVEQVVSLRDGVGGYIGVTANLAADGGGVLLDFGTGWYLANNGAFAADATASSVDVNVTDWGVE